MFVCILRSCALCCLPFFKHVYRHGTQLKGRNLWKRLPQGHDEISGSTADHHVNLTCQALSCCDYFPRLLRGIRVVSNLFLSAHFDSVSGHSELVVERVSKEDSGTYVCTAENSVGFVKAIGFVYVKGR